MLGALGSCERVGQIGAQERRAAARFVKPASPVAR